MAIIASLVVGANNATSMAGTSHLLSTPPDRARFLARHRSAAAFIIGKNSAAREMYSNSKVPIFVLSRSNTKLVLSNPAMEQVNVEKDFIEPLRIISERISGDIVVEAGHSLLIALSKEGLIDCLELTISPLDGDGDFIDLELLLSCYTVISEKNVNGTRLLECRNKSNSTNS